MESNKNIFEDLEDLGFKDISNIDIYDKKEEENKESKEVKEEEVKEEDLLYDKNVTCPVCSNKFKARVVKANAARIEGKDKDLCIRYKGINPYFYDVWICNTCGYSSMKADFDKIKEVEKERIITEISTKWRGRKYPEVYDVNIAIERYKISLLNYTVIGAKSSKKALNCLKIAWMYRLLEDTENEQLFLEQALLGFKDAYFNEAFPICGMDKFTIMYLIGELHRRLGNHSEALKQFGNVITSQGASRKVKDLAYDQKELIRETLQENNKEDFTEDKEEPKKKKGFFKRFFS
ncbi:MAG: DUF2225 domain-containing protein [Clostridiales bacterium]|nr:DUF2225 domain-containing protein [Clostridiales bacterium]NLZ48979.1 DUF2225 domain-containing protein [Clostridiales bacterium]